MASVVFAGPKPKEMVKPNDRGADDMPTSAAVWHQTFVLQSSGVSTEPCVQAVSFGIALSPQAAGQQEHITPAADTVKDKARAERAIKKIMPKDKTLHVIRLIKAGHANSRISEMLPDESIGNIRTIRARYERGQYAI